MATDNTFLEKVSQGEPCLNRTFLNTSKDPKDDLARNHQSNLQNITPAKVILEYKDNAPPTYMPLSVEFDKRKHPVIDKFWTDDNCCRCGNPSRDGWLWRCVHNRNIMIETADPEELPKHFIDNLGPLFVNHIRKHPSDEEFINHFTDRELRHLTLEQVERRKDDRRNALKVRDQDLLRQAQELYQGLHMEAIYIASPNLTTECKLMWCQRCIRDTSVQRQPLLRDSVIDGDIPGTVVSGFSWISRGERPVANAKVFRQIEGTYVPKNQRTPGPFLPSTTPNPNWTQKRDLSRIPNLYQARDDVATTWDYRDRIDPHSFNYTSDQSHIRSVRQYGWKPVQRVFVQGDLRALETDLTREAMLKEAPPVPDKAPSRPALTPVQPQAEEANGQPGSLQGFKQLVEISTHLPSPENMSHLLNPQVNFMFGGSEMRRGSRRQQAQAPQVTQATPQSAPQLVPHRNRNVTVEQHNEPRLAPMPSEAIPRQMSPEQNLVSRTLRRLSGVFRRREHGERSSDDSWNSSPISEDNSLDTNLPAPDHHIENQHVNARDSRFMEDISEVDMNHVQSTPHAAEIADAAQAGQSGTAAGNVPQPRQQFAQLNWSSDSNNGKKKAANGHLSVSPRDKMPSQNADLQSLTSQSIKTMALPYSPVDLLIGPSSHGRPSHNGLCGGPSAHTSKRSRQSSTPTIWRRSSQSDHSRRSSGPLNSNPLLETYHSETSPMIRTPYGYTNITGSRTHPPPGYTPIDISQTHTHPITTHGTARNTGLAHTASRRAIEDGLGLSATLDVGVTMAREAEISRLRGKADEILQRHSRTSDIIKQAEHPLNTVSESRLAEERQAQRLNTLRPGSRNSLDGHYTTMRPSPIVAPAYTQCPGYNPDPRDYGLCRRGAVRGRNTYLQNRTVRRPASIASTSSSAITEMPFNQHVHYQRPRVLDGPMDVVGRASRVPEHRVLGGGEAMRELETRLRGLRQEQTDGDGRE